MPSPTDAPASLPERLADAEGGLPEEIETAIDEFDYAVETCAKEGHPQFTVAVDEKRSALTATILARLTAAESAREAAVARAERLEKAVSKAVGFLNAGTSIWPKDSAHRQLGDALTEAGRLAITDA